MKFNNHRNLAGMHAPFTASQSSWLRYDDDKVLEAYANKKAAEIIEKAQAEIIARGNNPYYPIEQHMRDMDLIAELTELKIKYK